MKFKSSLVLDQQPSSDINKPQSNTLNVFTHGADMVFLSVSGSADAFGNGDSNIFTVMTVGEAVLLSQMLANGAAAADSGMDNGAQGVPYRKPLSQRFPLRALQEKNLVKQQAFFAGMAGLTA